MIVRINTGKSPSGAVRYNEQKVANGEAEIIGILNYPQGDVSQISVHNKIITLEDYVRINQRVEKPTVHISLSFHPTETFSNEALKTIGEEYMSKMGYGSQPMLIYRHEDTHHPHIHIVSIAITSDGKKISDSHAKQRSNTIRKRIEATYNLVKAEQQGKQQLFSLLSPEQLQQATPKDVKKAIGNIVLTGFKDYHF